MPDLDRRMMIAGASLLGAAALARVARAGDLDPPAGGVAPTGRSLREVEPRSPINLNTASLDVLAVFRITQPGAYVVTEPMTIPAGKSGIVVDTAGPVSIDLRGFAITGTPGCRKGIECVNPACSYLEVYDGFIRDCDEDGIDGGLADTLEVDDVDIQGGDAGIRKSMGRLKCSDVTLEGPYRGIVFSPGPGNPGAVTAVECIIDDCEMTSCGDSGIRIEGDYSGLDATIWISDCECHHCGLDGISVAVAASSAPTGNERVNICIDECNCNNNGRFGVGVLAPVSPLGTPVSVVLECSDCTCAMNGAEGMRIQAVRATICDFDCVSNGAHGMTLVDVTGSVECCLCSDNALSGMTATNVQGVLDEVDCRANGSHGMECNGFSGSIDCCECSNNVGAGMQLSAGSQATCVCDCGYHFNGLQGFHADVSCTGLSVTECDSQSNSVGFQVDCTSALLLWNTARGNSVPYQTDPATPIVVVSGADIMVDQRPAANYAY